MGMRLQERAICRPFLRITGSRERPPPRPPAASTPPPEGNWGFYSPPWRGGQSTARQGGVRASRGRGRPKAAPTTKSPYITCFSCFYSQVPRIYFLFVLKIGFLCCFRVCGVQNLHKWVNFIMFSPAFGGGKHKKVNAGDVFLQRRTLHSAEASCMILTTNTL